MSYEDYYLDGSGNVCFWKIHRDVMRQQFERDCGIHNPELSRRLASCDSSDRDNQSSPSTGILGAHRVPIGAPIPKPKQSNIEEHLYTLLGMALHHGCDDMVDKIQTTIKEL